MATAEEIRNAARAKAGLAEAQANAAKTAAANAAAAKARADAAKKKADADAKAKADAANKNKSVTKTVVSTDSYTDANGNVIEVTIFSDGTRTTRNLGLDPSVAAQRTNWIEELKARYEESGLGTLADRIIEFVKQGFSPQTIDFKITETPEFKLRFPANEARKKAGLPVLSLDEYIAVENSYQSILRQSNIPKGFYDSKDDFTKFIANDVSPQELKSRVDIADRFVDGVESYFTDSLQRFYGLSKGDLVAYALDPERAMPLITRQVRAAEFGGEAARQGLQIGAGMAEQYTGGPLGISQTQARQGFEQVAQIAPQAERLSRISDASQPFGLEEVTSAVFGGEQSAGYKQKLQSLAEQEQSRFAGQSGVTRGSLAKGTSGQF
jgi:hypothetical protein